MKNVVLVLGAGASKPYGFPLGGELKDNIADVLSNNIKWGEIWEDFSSDADIEIKRSKLIKLLRDEPSIDTIDNLIARNPKDIELMRRLISEAILYRELMHKPTSNSVDPYKLGKNVNGDWYGWLFNTYFYSNDGIRNKFKLTILTYNYDRSFEFYFIRALTVHFGLEEKEAIKLFYNTISVHHMNGGFGKLSSFKEYGEISTQKVSFPFEIRDSNYSQDLVDDVLLESDIIMFLGFAYNPVNMKRLRPNDNLSGKEIYGSTFSMENVDVERVKGEWSWRIITDSSKLGVYGFLNRRIGSSRLI